jgi:hypothetical protein
MNKTKKVHLVQKSKITTTRKKGATVMRSAKRKASSRILSGNSAFGSDGDESETDNSHGTNSSIQGLLKVLNIDNAVVLPMCKDANERTIGRWVNIMEDILERCLTICVEDSEGSNLLKKALTM